MPEQLDWFTVKKSDRGYISIHARKYASVSENTRLVEASSAVCLDYTDAFELPGSSYLWIGQDHHLSRDGIKELVRILNFWLDNKTLEGIPTQKPIDDEFPSMPWSTIWLEAVGFRKSSPGENIEIFQIANGRLELELIDPGVAMGKLAIWRICGHVIPTMLCPKTTGDVVELCKKCDVELQG